MDAVPTKFFPRDVIGRKPKKIGDTFKAEFLGETFEWRVTRYGETWYMAVMTEDQLP